jgi:hypothetical protein
MRGCKTLSDVEGLLPHTDKAATRHEISMKPVRQGAVRSVRTSLLHQQWPLSKPRHAVSVNGEHGFAGDAAVEQGAADRRRF